MLLGLGLEMEDLPRLSAAAWDSYVRVAYMRDVDQYKMLFNSTLAAVRGSSPASLRAQLRLQYQHFLFGRPVDPVKMAELSMTGGANAVPVGPLSTATDHIAVGINTDQSADISHLPPHIRRAHERHQRQAASAGGPANP